MGNYRQQNNRITQNQKIMKYTKQQAEKLKTKGMDGFTKYNRPLPDVQIVDGFYIVPSKMNTK